MVKRQIRLAGLLTGALLSDASAGELLEHISDDSAVPIATSAPAGKPSNDERKITYRVICSPEDQDLPDCDRAADNGGNAAPAMDIAVPDLPPDAQDLAEQAAQSKAAATAKTESEKHSAKHARHAAKKTTGHKKPRR